MHTLTPLQLEAVSHAQTVADITGGVLLIVLLILVGMAAAVAVLLCVSELADVLEELAATLCRIRTNRADLSTWC